MNCFNSPKNMLLFINVFALILALNLSEKITEEDLLDSKNFLTSPPPLYPPSRGRPQRLR